ncbi:RNA-binding ribosome biosynthesis protein mak21 [Hypoxylon texense]
MSTARVRASVLAQVVRSRRLTGNPRINVPVALGPSRRLPPCRFVSTAPIPDPSLPPPRSFFRRAVSFVALGIVFTSLGIVMGSIPAMPAVSGLLNPPTDEETLAMYAPATEQEREVEDFINRHPLTLAMRAKEGFAESRPHLKIPQPFRDYNLTGGTLLGANRIVVPPVIFAESGGKSLVSISYLGHELCGHPGIIHGGLLATLLDEGLARCCFAALPHKVGMTANLNINYRAPAPAGSYIVLKATTTKVEGRKAWVEGRIETLVGEGEKPVVLAEATALFVSPKQAAMMMNVYPTT